MKNDCNFKTLDWKSGVYSKYKPFLQRDREVIKKLLKGVEGRRPSEVQSALLRRHLLELTQSFLLPLERYIARLMPLQRNVSPFKRTPVLQRFSQDEFLKTLDTSGPQLTSGIKGDWAGLYKRFFLSRNFVLWYDSRENEANQKLGLLHIEAISGANLVDWIRDKDEVEVVDLVLRLKEKLMLIETENLPVSADVAEKLHTHLCQIIETLPEDLQGILRK